MARVLVTGGSGYIAGFTIRQLVEAGWDVNTTIRSLTRESEVRDWLAVDNARLSFFAADLTNDIGWAGRSRAARMSRISRRRSRPVRPCMRTN